jgi:hypothetical protein
MLLQQLAMRLQGIHPRARTMPSSCAPSWSWPATGRLRSWPKGWRRNRSGICWRTWAVTWPRAMA